MESAESGATAPYWKLILVGVTAGLLSGFFGIGGGVVMVPLLVWIGFERHRAHATSLAGIVPIAIAGALTFGLAGEVDLTVGILIGAGGVVGGIVGASMMHRLSARALTIVFGVILLIAAIRLMFGGSPMQGSGDLALIATGAIAVGIGLFSGFQAGIAGVGGGVIIVPATVFFLGFDQHLAQGTSLVAIVATAVAGSIVNFRNRRVRVRDGLVIGIAGVVASVVAANLALGVAGRTLSIVFGALMLITAAQTFYGALRSPGRA